MKLKVVVFILLSILLFSASAWARLTKTEVSQLYVAIFNRASEGEGNIHWQSQPDMSTAATAMLDTQAARDYFGANLNTNQAFIEHIYLNTLNKTIVDDFDGISYWIGLLDAGTSRGEAVSSLVGVIKDYAPVGPHYDPDNTATIAAYWQFTNRVMVSDYMADTVYDTPADWATSTQFTPTGLNVTSDPLSIDVARNIISDMGSGGSSMGIVIWANTGEDKVTQDELRANTDATAVTNSVWDGSKISLFGAKNEVTSFNVILEAPRTAASKVSVSFNSLSDNSGNTISSKTVSGDGVFDFTNRNIELFYIRYLEIKGLSTDLFFSGYNYDERHIPERMRRPWTGDGEGSGTWQDRPDHNKFYPDIAVPIELVSSFDIKSGQNQSIWTDIYIPKTTPAGVFSGKFTVKENGVTVKEIPVELTVMDFSLPDLPTARTMLAYTQEDINKRYLGNGYPASDSSEYQQSMAIIDTHFKVAHRHRISLINGYIETDQMTSDWETRLSGTLFTAANGYDGPGVGVGNNVYSIGTYSSWPWSEGTQQDMWTNTNQWVDWFEAQNFSTPTEYFLYLIDESDEFSQTEQWAQWIDANTASGSRLMSLATIGLPDATNSVPSLDIPTAWVQMADTAKWQAAADAIKADPTKKLFLYNGGRPGSGTFAIEDEGISPRVIAWTHYKMKVDRWFYWDCAYYNNYQGEMGETNVFQKAHTYGSYSEVDEVYGETGWNYLNGDGVLFYPGTDTVYSSESYGVKGPFASLRLKHWRRGLQDYEYLVLAAAADVTQTSAIVSKTIPKVVWEVCVEDVNDPTYVYTDISWSTDPDAWEKTRKDLADIITNASSTVSHGCKITGMTATAPPQL